LASPRQLWLLSRPGRERKRCLAGRRLKAGQVRVFGTGQQADHVTAADRYQLVALAVDGGLVRHEVPALGGFDPEGRLAGKEVVTTSPACCRALWSHLVGLLDLAQARPDLFAQPGRLIEQECLRRFAGPAARQNDDRAACRPPNRARVVRRAEEYMRAHLGAPCPCSTFVGKPPSASGRCTTRSGRPAA
jgi:hypothetical protein